MTVLVEHHGAVAVVTLNRPERRNAITDAMRAALREQLSDLDADPSVCVVVLTGAGTAFCGGGDTGEMQARNLRGEAFAQRRRHYLDEPAATAMALVDFAKPVIAAINGAAIGAGLGIALLADIRIAGDTAVFAAPFARLGLTPDWALGYLLPRAVGAENAARMLMTGRTVDAAGAAELGLVGEVVPAGELMAHALSLAEEVAAAAPLGLIATRAALNRHSRDEIQRALRIEAEEQSRLALTEDHQEALAARQERRSPQFRGR